MTNILLVSEDYVKSNSNIDDNLWSKMLVPAIREAQEMGLQPIIGTSLYKKILDVVETGSVKETANSAYKNLLDVYVQPFLLYQVMVNVIPVIGTKLSNMGVMQSDDEKSHNVSKNERDNLMTYYQYRADFYTQRMQDYLTKHRAEYPELDDNDIANMSANLNSSHSCNIWLGGARGYVYNDNSYVGK